MGDFKAGGTRKSSWSRRIRILGLILTLLIVLVLLAPLIIAKIGLRDRLINAILASPSVTASSTSASFGWFSPLGIRGLQLTSNNQRLQIDVDEIAAERSPLQLLASAPDLGTIKLVKPHLRLELPLDLKIERHRRLEPTFTAVVSDAALTLSVPALDEPSVEVDGLNMTLRVEQAGDGRVLTLDPMVVFDRRELSPKLGKKLLHLIDPTLSDAPEVRGRFSLSLEKVRIPIGIPNDQLLQRVEVEGKLGLHQVTSQVNNPMRQALVQLLADINGRPASEVVQLVQDTEVRFQVRDGRLYHEGLRIGFPDIDPGLQVTSRGSVGLDQTLDLNVELPRLDPIQRKAKGPARCHITGTIRNPKISVEDASLVLRQPERKEPLIAVDGVNLKMQVENTPSGYVLAVEPVEVLKKEKLNLGLTGGLVRLIDPDLQSARDVTGEMSLAFKTLRIPLGGATDQLAKRLEADGILTLHQVSTEAKDRGPMRQALVKLLADLHGKEASKVLRLAQDAVIHFQVRDGRLHYEGLRIGFPEINPDLIVLSRGAVGLDETLDLRLDLPRLRKDKQKENGPVRCHITGTLRDPRILLEDASLVINLAEGGKPALQVGNVNLRFSVEDTKDGRMLALAPVTLLEKQKLTPDIGDELLHLIVPSLSDISDVRGEISLALERFRVPLSASEGQWIKKLDLAGELKLHQISAAVKAPVLEVMVKVLADMHGKKPSQVVRVVKDAVIRFQVRDGRVYHEGLRIGFPDIDPSLLVGSRGSVGLDRSLDIVLEVPRIVGPGGKAPAVTTPVWLRVTGTIEKPVVTEIKDVKVK